MTTVEPRALAGSSLRPHPRQVKARKQVHASSERRWVWWTGFFKLSERLGKGERLALANVLFST
jgi:hypothetical protein